MKLDMKPIFPVVADSFPVVAVKVDDISNGMRERRGNWRKREKQRWKKGLETESCHQNHFIDQVTSPKRMREWNLKRKKGIWETKVLSAETDTKGYKRATCVPSCGLLSLNMYPFVSLPHYLFSFWPKETKKVNKGFDTHHLWLLQGLLHQLSLCQLQLSLTHLSLQLQTEIPSLVLFYSTRCSWSPSWRWRWFRGVCCSPVTAGCLLMVNRKEMILKRRQCLLSMPLTSGEETEAKPREWTKHCLRSQSQRDCAFHSLLQYLLNTRLIFNSIERESIRRFSSLWRTTLDLHPNSSISFSPLRKGIDWCSLWLVKMFGNEISGEMKRSIFSFYRRIHST